MGFFTKKLYNSVKSFLFFTVTHFLCTFMKVLQLNVWGFNCGDYLLDFIADQKPDVLNFQEVTTPNFSGFSPEKNICRRQGVDYWSLIKSKFGLEGVFIPSFGLRNEDGDIGYFGNGILSRLPILDYGCLYDQPLQIIDQNHELYQPQPTEILQKASRLIGSMKLPTTILYTVLQLGNIYIKNITTHFRVTEKCTENLQTFEHAERILNFLDNSRVMPTILTGDFNIHPLSYSIFKISQKLQMANQNSLNSLNPEIHPAIFNGDLPQGVLVDYIFYRDLVLRDSYLPKVTVSDHLPVIAEFDI